MRALALCVAVLVILAFAPTVLGDVRDPGKVNKIFPYGTFATPDLTPGGAGPLSFNISNPYDEPIYNVVLNVSIYQYAEQEISMTVDSSWRWQYPRFEGAPKPDSNVSFTNSSMAVNESHRITLTVLTSTDMPHGGIFTQGAYFVRFWLTFVHNGSTARMASPGYWSKEQFYHATQDMDECTPADCLGQLNLTRLGRIDGILPDTAFGVKDSIPQWPFYVFAAGSAFFAVLAFLYYAEENASKFPRTARAFLGFKGRLRRIFRPRKGAKPPKGE